MIYINCIVLYFGGYSMTLIIEKYLKENIDDELKINPIQDDYPFSIMLKDNYNFYLMSVLNNTCLLIEITHKLPEIDKLQKQLNQLRNITDNEIVLLIKEISTFKRKTLIKNKISFVIENGQMYLPFLGLDLKKINTITKEKKKLFSIPSQIAYMYFLINKNIEINASDYANVLGINIMTASRALNELYNAHLLNYKIEGKTGRSKVYRRVDDPNYFLKGQEYLKNPVRKIVYTHSKPVESLVAGLDALSTLSMINPPEHSIVAIDYKKLYELQYYVENKDDYIYDKKPIEVQLWDYDPKMFTHNNDHVNLISLYASLKDERDERIEQALNEVLRGETWYRD